MTALSDKLVLLAASFLFLLYTAPQDGALPVLSLLYAIIYSCLTSYHNPDLISFSALKKPDRIMTGLLHFLFLVLALIHPVFSAFLSLLFYEVFGSMTWYSCLIPAASLFFSLRDAPPLTFLLAVLLFLLAFLLKCKTLRLTKLEKDFKALRDTSTEYNLLLNQKNKDLIEKQDYEIHVATLKERNRIAREIHDNVGHMLSRSILQAGALIAVNTQAALKDPLAALKNTLNSAMDSIRESVHDLHDDSIDLQSAIQGLLQDFTFCQTGFEYDMGNQIPRNIKYCFITILKEALSNTARHSNATRLHIVVREHPGFYQLLIQDNGTDISMQDPGMGLENMRERVEGLRGNFSVSTSRGFRIFVSIPIFRSGNMPK